MTIRCLSALTVMFVALTGCSTTQTVSDLNYSLTDIEKSISEMFPNGIAKVSSNGREYTSAYFKPETVLPDFDKSFKKRKNTRRATVTAIVLGDRRPYQLEVSTEIEQRESEAKMSRIQKLDLMNGEWRSEGSSRELAKKIADNIYDYLIRRDQKKNIIDDFRPF